MLILLLVICMIYGVIALAVPEAIWELQEKMRYKDSDREPSTAGLVMIRLQGAAVAVMAVVGIVMKVQGRF